MARYSLAEFVNQTEQKDRGEGFFEKRQRAFDIVAKTVVLKELNGPRGAGRYVACLSLWLPAVVILAGLGTPRFGGCHSGSNR